MTKAVLLIELLDNIDKISKAIPILGLKINSITPKIQFFDLLIFSTLNRTVNLNRAFVNSMKDNNYISAAPLVRINLDSLLRMYAARISEYSLNEFAEKVLNGEHIRKMRYFTF